MNIICDTSVIFLVIRIAPDMFINPEYECCTIQCVRDEIFQTTKFKSKYPWVNSFNNKIKCLPSQILNTKAHQKYFKVISTLNNVGTINRYIDKLFQLSYTDMTLLSCALANGFKLSTGDLSISNFGSQEFEGEYKGYVSALELVNTWLTKDLIKWNSTLNSYIIDWNKQNEHPQPKDQKKNFEKLTDYKYEGS